MSLARLRCRSGLSCRRRSQATFPPFKRRRRSQTRSRHRETTQGSGETRDPNTRVYGVWSGKSRGVFPRSSVRETRVVSSFQGKTYILSPVGESRGIICSKDPRLEARRAPFLRCRSPCRYEFSLRVNLDQQAIQRSRVRAEYRAGTDCIAFQIDISRRARDPENSPVPRASGNNGECPPLKRRRIDGKVAGPFGRSTDVQREWIQRRQ